MKPKPEILYKYRSLSGDNLKFTHDIFMKNELYFPHPDQINDPFDCKIPRCLEGLTKEKLLEQFEARTGKLSENKKRTILENIKNNPMSEIVKCLEQAPNRHQEVGILSLSQKKSDILMWGHYADSHKGICIGFDYNKFSFTFGTPLPPKQVKYPEDNEYPKWNPFNDNVMTLIDKVYFTKSIDWKYEQEWRVLFLEQGSTLQKINPNAIVSVHLGCEIAKGDKEKVINWCLQREQKPKVYEMIKDDTSYALKENEISY